MAIQLSDIKIFQSGSYSVDADWDSIKDHIERYISEYGLDTNPDFQRGHVWTEDQQSKYIEFIIKGGNSGKELYFNHEGWMGDFKGDFVLVDGKQRLSAVLKFVGNSLRVFNGNLLSDFPEKDQRFILRRNGFKININNLSSKKDVLGWYLNFNTGGTPHSEIEISRVRKLFEEES